ncbi:MAG: XRE family transcriptional regulator [Humidesulfovibrio sp.]
MTTWKKQYPIIKAKADAALKAEGKSYSLASMAGLLGASRGKVQAWERGQRPSADDLQKMAEVLGLSPAWLLLEEGEPEDMLTIRRLASNAPHDPACIVGPDDTTPVGQVVPVHAMAAAGPALDRWEPVPICHVCIPLTYYRESVLIVQIEGRSMEPEIKSGAFVGLDTAQLDLVPGERYGVRIPYEGLTVKRVFIDPKAKELVLRSINPEHPEMRVDLDDRDGLIVGRAVWVMQGL